MKILAAIFLGVPAAAVLALALWGAFEVLYVIGYILFIILEGVVALMTGQL